MAAPVTMLHPPSNFSVKQILSSRPDVGKIGPLANNLQMVQLHSPHETLNRSLAPPPGAYASTVCMSRHPALSQAPHGMAVLTTALPHRPVVAWQPMAVLPNWQIGDHGKMSREAIAPLFSQLAPPSVPFIKNAVDASFSCSYNCDTTPRDFPSACHSLDARMRELRFKSKKRRTVFTREQIDQLEATFDAKRYLSSTDRVKLSVLLNMSETQVKVWFQNRRNKWKRDRALGDRRREGYDEEQAESRLTEKDDEIDFSTDDDLTEEEDCDGNFSIRHKPSEA